MGELLTILMEALPMLEGPSGASPEVTIMARGPLNPNLTMVPVLPIILMEVLPMLDVLCGEPGEARDRLNQDTMEVTMEAMVMVVMVMEVMAMEANMEATMVTMDKFAH